MGLAVALSSARPARDVGSVVRCSGQKTGAATGRVMTEADDDARLQAGAAEASRRSLKCQGGGEGVWALQFGEVPRPGQPVDTNGGDVVA